MKQSVIFLCVLFAIVIFDHKISADESTTEHGIQILSPTKDHTFYFEYDEVNRILNASDIRDRHVVVVSIAGAFRQGKSFLLNFFLKYLYAQYKKHDITDWLGEQSDNNIFKGFEWQHGRKRKTLGVLMWSEIFTHDFPNGDKVAIIVLDTQGIFDDKTSVKECTTIFALSTMISSVTCYNIMQNIQEDHLQHLQLFTQYGQMVMQESNEKPFQKLLFLVRDWPYAFDTGYGWNGTAIIDETLALNEDQTPEMQQLRSQIRMSFQEIGAFLLPHPGMAVARGQNFNGNQKQIDQEFIMYVKELTPSLFAPENLIVKKINGHKVRARDLVQYLQTYTSVFNGNTLPEPQSIYDATVQAHNLILSNECVSNYSESMQTQLDRMETFFKEEELLTLHQNAKTEAITKFQTTPKLGSDSALQKVLSNTEANIEKKFESIKQVNDEKRKIFIEKANLHNEKLCFELGNVLETEVLKQINDLNVVLNEENLNKTLEVLEIKEVDEFNDRKMGDDDISKEYRVQLTTDIANLRSSLNETFYSYNKFVNFYNKSMEQSLDEVETFFKPAQMLEIHGITKRSTISQFLENINSQGEKLVSPFQRRIEKTIDDQFQSFQQENDKKRMIFTEKANLHNKQLIKEINDTLVNGMVAEIDKIDVDSSELRLERVFRILEKAALQKFKTERMGDDEISSGFREALELNLNEFQSNLTSTSRACDQYLDEFSKSMQKSIDENSAYYESDEFNRLFEGKKNHYINQFQEANLFKNTELFNSFRNKMGAMISRKLTNFENKNDAKRRTYINTINSKNEALVSRLVHQAEENGMLEVNWADTFLCDVGRVHSNLEWSALRQFDSQKRGDEQLSRWARNELSSKLSGVYSRMNNANNQKRDRFWANENSKTSFWSVLGGIGGAVGGFMIGGPPGAMLGAAGGFAGAKVTRNAMSEGCSS